MTSLIDALTLIDDADIPKFYCVPGLIEGLLSNVVPPLAKVFFFRTLHSGKGPFDERLFFQWTHSAQDAKEALDALCKTRLWRKKKRHSETEYTFVAEAQADFIQRLLLEKSTETPVRASLSPRQVWKLGRKQWAAFEHACVSTTDVRGEKTTVLGKCTRIVQQQHRRPWKWLMQSRQKQLWDLFLRYFGKENLPNALVTVFSMMSLKLGESLCKDGCKTLTLDFFELVGCLVREPNGALAITPLALCLFRDDVDLAVSRNDCGDLPASCFANKPNEGISETVGGIVVESNFRLFAYTSDPIMHQLISRFCVIENEIGGHLVVGTITVDSVLKALQSDISAQDIISFLETRRHKQCEALPTNVKLQLQLWEEDRVRLNMEDSTLFQWTAKDYNKPNAQREFQACYAAAGDFVLWSRLWHQADPVQRLYPAFVVRKEKVHRVLQIHREHDLLET